MWQVWRRAEENTGFWWGNPGGRRPFVRPRHRWDNNSKMDFKEIRRGLGLDRSG